MILFWTFKKRKKCVLENAKLDPSIIGVGFKKHDIMPSTIHRSVECCEASLNQLRSENMLRPISSDSAATAELDAN